MFKKFIFVISFFSLMFFSFNSSAEIEETYIKINYGISNHDTGITAKHGTIVLDEKDEGFIISLGGMINDSNLGIDLMYYDLGTVSIKVDAAESIQHENNKLVHAVDTAGTITSDVTGYGLGLIFVSDTDNTGLGTINFYIKGGTHAWDKSGNSTLFRNDNGWNKSYYNQGWGAYGGLGLAINVNENIAVDFSYDILGISSDVSFDNMTSLLGAGLRMSF